MSTVPHLRAPRAVAFALLATAGVAAGWLLFLGPGLGPGRSYESVYAVLDPASVAAVSIVLLCSKAEQSRWVVPLLLLGVLLDVAILPQTPLLTALGIAAGVLASLAVRSGLHRAAIVGTVVCCTSVAASLLAALPS